MTVLLVVLTFAVFLSIDYLRSRKRVEQPATGISPVPMPTQPRVQSPIVAGFQLPANLRYHPGHTWAVSETPTSVRVGVDDFAARFAGKIESISLPKRGQWIRQGQKFLAMLKDGRRAELVSPIEGEVTDVNETVLKDASLACRDPYGEGWLLAVHSPDAATSFRNLLGGALACRWMEDAARRLMFNIPELAGAVAQDGGLAVPDTGAQLSDELWNDLAHEFFLT
jgi:glycine cleavage system H lipoate-binding protein